MKLLGIGGAHIDRRGQVSGDYVPAASNPGTMVEDIGGGTLNGLRSAAQRGIDCALISVRGGDAAGEAVARSASDAGIRDLSVTFLNRATPSYTALIDRHGELIAGFADMGLYDLAFPKQMRRSMVRAALAGTDAVLCDANVPAAGLERLTGLAAGKPVFAIGVSPAKVVRLAGVLAGLECLFVNTREAEALVHELAPSPSRAAPEPPLPRSAGARNPSSETESGSSAEELAAALRYGGLRSAVITAGGGAITGFDVDGVFELKPPAPRWVVDVTGAGDALAGATIAAMMAGKPLRVALREGVAASLLAIESARAAPELSKQAFAEALALVPEARAVA